MINRKIKILDTTLRDGLQGEEIAFSVSDKLNIVRLLDEFGVSYIEAGNPASNPKDCMFFEQAATLSLKNSKLCAFGSTRRKDIQACEDSNLNALVQANTQVVVIFGKAWDWHVSEVLKATLEENLLMISDTIRYLKQFEKEVIFDAEHFYDGFCANREYAIKVVETAISAGADVVCLCDTNGGILPTKLYSITKEITTQFETSEFAIHAHNDSGCAIANSLMAVEAGITQVQGTFIGFGERCGNSDLSTIIPNIVLKEGIACDGDLTKLCSIATAISEISNSKLEKNRPYIGKGAFAHKAGMHIDGVLKNPATFEHINPEAVGNRRRFLLSEVSGRGMVLEKIKPYAPTLEKGSPELETIIEKLKILEHFGYQFEAADASFELLVKKITGTYQKHFSLVLYKTIGDFPVPEGECSASAMIKIEVDGKTEITAEQGNGPVNALDKALRKALVVFYPSISTMQLSDYKVRVLEQNAATAAKVRVLIESTDGAATWTTIGVSNDIIEASLSALIDSIEYKLGVRE